MRIFRMARFLIIAFSSLGLLMYAHLGNYTRMLADDFCSLHFAERLGLFRSVWYWYLNWSGRYTAFAADWLILQFTLGPYKLHYVVPATIFLWLLCITATLYLYLWNPGQPALLNSLTLACVFLYTVFVLSPGIPQSLFWWNGMRSYTLPLFVLTFYVLIFQLAVKHLKLHAIAYSALGFILFFLSGGLGETFIVAQIVFLLFIIYLIVLKLLDRPKADLMIILSCLAGSVCSLIVVVLAPGNAIRLGSAPVTPNLTQLVMISLQSYIVFMGEFFSDPAKISGLIGAVFAVMWIGGYYKDLVPKKIHLVLWYVLGGLAISFACFPPGVYVYFEAPPARTMIIPVFFLVAGVLSASFLTGGFLSTRYGVLWNASRVLVFSIVSIFGFSVVVTSWKLYEMRNVYVDFAEKWDRVDAQILQAKANHLDSVNIPDMSNWAGLEIPTDNPKYWPTICYSDYYGIQVVGPPAPYP